MHFVLPFGKWKLYIFQGICVICVCLHKYILYFSKNAHIQIHKICLNDFYYFMTISAMINFLSQFHIFRISTGFKWTFRFIFYHYIQTQFYCVFKVISDNFTNEKFQPLSEPIKIQDLFRTSTQRLISYVADK